MNKNILIFLFSVSLAVSQVKADNVYTFRIFPLQDTIVAGIDNELQVMLDGKIATNLLVTEPRGKLHYKGEGKYIISGCAPGDPVQVLVFNESDLVLQKVFTAIAPTDEMNKRIATLKNQHDALQATENAAAANGHVYSVVITPFQDTLLPGFDNTMQIYVDGKPNTDFDGIKYSIDHGTALPSMRRGTYILQVSGVENAEIVVEKNDKVVLTQKIVVPQMTPALKARAIAKGATPSQ